jgi:hypothetical protein
LVKIRKVEARTAETHRSKDSEAVEPAQVGASYSVVDWFANLFEDWTIGSVFEGLFAERTDLRS